MADPRPIGVFDSGVGGLSVVQELRRQLPYEDVVYFADTANCPYGTKPAAEVGRLATEAVEFLVELRAKLVVVACNSASTAAVAQLRQAFPLPFIGMEPAVKPAALSSESRVIGVLATEVTLGGPIFARLVDQYAREVRVMVDPVPGLVEAVEAGDVDSTQTRRILEQALGPILDAGADHIVLGCTHFPFARGTIEAICGQRAAVIDSGTAVVRQTGRILERHGLQAERSRPGIVELYCSGDRDEFEASVLRLTGEGVAGPVR